MILNVTGNREAISLRCVIELLKYNNGRVLLDIRGHHLAETQFGHITREHPDALERVFEDVDDYVHMSFLHHVVVTVRRLSVTRGFLLRKLPTIQTLF